MDTNSNIPVEKKVVSVEILHLDEIGYGPQGKHTRREWRAECLENLLAGRGVFEKWQDGWKDQITKNLRLKEFSIKLIYSDDSTSIEEIQIPGFFGSVVPRPFAFDFIGLNFDTAFYARSKQFQQITLFAYTTFNMKASFSSSKFNKDVNFNNAIFKKRADFISTKFHEYADFSDVIFSSDAYFMRAIFNNVTFQRAYFKTAGIFRAALFFEAVNFSGAIFQALCRFDSKSDSSEITKFKDKAYFENAFFNNVGHFERVRFLTHTPAFRGCKIDSTRLEFSDDSYFPRDENSEDSIKNISFLKRLAEEHGQTDQALNFNSMELRAKRKQLEPQAAHWSFKAVTWLYEKVSDYGRSFLRPLLGYGALVVCSILLTLPLSDYSQDTTPVAVANRALCVPKNKEEAAKQLQLTHGRAAFEYAMFRAGGVLDFTDTGKQNNTVNCTLFGQPIEPPLMRAWGIFKGIASIALLFLAALGLRNKYRIK